MTEVTEGGSQNWPAKILTDLAHLAGVVHRANSGGVLEGSVTTVTRNPKRQQEGPEAPLRCVLAEVTEEVTEPNLRHLRHRQSERMASTTPMTSGDAVPPVWTASPPAPGRHVSGAW